MNVLARMQDVGRGADSGEWSEALHRADAVNVPDDTTELRFGGLGEELFKGC